MLKNFGLSKNFQTRLAVILSNYFCNLLGEEEERVQMISVYFVFQT